MFSIAALIAAPVFIDLNKYKSDFSAVIKNFTGVEPVIEGDVRITLFPKPNIKISGIHVPNIDGAANSFIFSADSMEAGFSLQALFSGRFDPSSIILTHPQLNFEELPSGAQNWEMLLSKKQTDQQLNIPLNIIINNGSVLYHTKEKKLAIESISASVEADSVHGPFNMEGSFLSGINTIKFSSKIGNLEENSDVVFNISSDSFDFAINGQYRPGKEFDLHGSSELNIKNAGTFVEAFFATTPFVSEIKAAENISLKGDFMISKEISSFNKIHIESGSIKGKGNIDLLYGAGRGGDVQWDVTMDIDTINLDSLRKAPEKETDDETINYYTQGAAKFNLADYRFDFPTSLSALFSVFVKEVVYNGDKVENVNIDTDIFNGKAIIHSLSADMPGASNIEFVGNIDNNGTRPLLTGKLKASGSNLRTVLVWIYPAYVFVPEDELKEFLFSGDLNVTPRKMTISNIYGSVDKSLLTGSLFVRPSDTIPSIKADIKLDRINFDNYNATPQIDKFIREFLLSAQNSNIDSSWLKLFNYRFALAISGDDLVYNGNNIKNFSFISSITKGIFNVQRVMVNSDLISLSGNAMVDFNKEIPEFNVDIASPYFDSAALLLKDDSQQENAAAPDSASIWSKEPFNLMGIDRFYGKLNLAANSFKYKNLNLANVSVKGNLERKIFAISECKADWGASGKVSIRGSVGVSKESPSMALSVVLSAIDLQDLLHVAESENTTKGTIYIGGVLKTFGGSPYDWVNELKTTTKFAARNVEINGFDLPRIIEQSRKLYSVIDMDAVVKSATKEGTTIFTAIDGNLTGEKSIIQAKDFALSTNASRGMFLGNISLHNMNMKGVAKISYIPEINKKTTLSLNLDGKLPDNITYVMDSSNLEQYITGKAGGAVQGGAATPVPAAVQ